MATKKPEELIEEAPATPPAAPPTVRVHTGDVLREQAELKARVSTLEHETGIVANEAAAEDDEEDVEEEPKAAPKKAAKAPPGKPAPKAAPGRHELDDFMGFARTTLRNLLRPVEVFA